MKSVDIAGMYPGNVFPNLNLISFNKLYELVQYNFCRIDGKCSLIGNKNLVRHLSKIIL